MYGIDLMIDQDFNPQILEVNFFPDCKRATVQFPTFTNDIFNSMIYDELNNLVEI